ncbi:MAG TPA: glycosyltransferase [Candidatus Nanoarchaeia archaeon]|nr:glycosyltransferase [Candidatus Nanoarchaeia archaeon]
MKNPKISVIIPVYKPEEEIFEKVKEMLKRQTVEAEIVENWNMPEAKSINTGIKKSQGKIIVTLAQDCMPSDEKWLEKLVKPLEDKKIVASVSDLYLPKWYWEKYPFFTKILCLDERVIRRPVMDARACAFRRKDLEKVGFFNEDPKVIGIDSDLYLKLAKIGKIKHPNCVVYHLHPLTNQKKNKLSYNYGEGNGKLVRRYKNKIHGVWRRVLRAIPIIGLLPIFFVFPYKRYFYYFPAYALFSIITHLLWVYGFWHGFFLDKESERNTEALKK